MNFYLRYKFFDIRKSNNLKSSHLKINRVNFKSLLFFINSIELTYFYLNVPCILSLSYMTRYVLGRAQVVEHQ